MGTGFARRKKEKKLMENRLQGMQRAMTALQEEGKSGNGLVSVVINGDKDLLHLSIHRDCVDPDDVEGLEDLIKDAFRDASSKLSERLSHDNPF